MKVYLLIGRVKTDDWAGDDVMGVYPDLNSLRKEVLSPENDYYDLLMNEGYYSFGYVESELGSKVDVPSQYVSLSSFDDLKVMLYPWHKVVA